MRAAVGIALVLAACSEPSPPEQRPPVGTKERLRPTGPLRWERDEAAAFARARTERKAVLIHFAATWSLPSEELRLQLNDLAAVIDRSFVPLEIDVSETTDAIDAVRERYAAKTLPALLLVATDGTVLGRATGLLELAELRALIGASEASVRSIQGAAKRPTGS